MTKDVVLGRCASRLTEKFDRTLGMSDFDGKGLFDRMLTELFESYSKKIICTHVAHKRHIMKKIRILCLLCAHHNVPDVHI